MPLTKKGKKIMRSMKEQYGEEKGEQVFYASENKGVIEGVHKKKKSTHHSAPMGSWWEKRSNL